MLVAYRGAGEAVGCGGVKHHGEWSEVKRLWVAPAARGLGLARRLLAALEADAARAGATAVRLDASRHLGEARKLFASAGHRDVAPFDAEPFADVWFEQRLEPSSG